MLPVVLMGRLAIDTRFQAWDLVPRFCPMAGPETGRGFTGRSGLYDGPVGAARCAASGGPDSIRSLGAWAGGASSSLVDDLLGALRNAAGPGRPAQGRSSRNWSKIPIPHRTHPPWTRRPPCGPARAPCPSAIPTYAGQSTMRIMRISTESWASGPSTRPWSAGAGTVPSAFGRWTERRVPPGSRRAR